MSFLTEDELRARVDAVVTGHELQHSPEKGMRIPRELRSEPMRGWVRYPMRPDINYEDDASGVGPR